MNRRKVLKILGSGCVIAAAGTGAIGYLFSEPGVEYPDTPWQTVNDSHEDPRIRALSYAILAPNPHNRQPWLVKLKGQSDIILYCQLDRRLPQTDPYDRQILIGLGCFGELLRIAASNDGYDARIKWFPQGEPSGKRLDRNAVARIEFVKGADPDPLFAQILDRRSNKEPFDTNRQVTNTALTQFNGNDKDVHTTNDPALVKTLRKLTMDSWMVEIKTPRTYKESVDLMRIGNKEVNEQPDGIDLGGSFFSIMKNLGLVTRDKIINPNSLAYKQGIPHFEDIMYSAMAYTWISSPGDTRMDQVVAGIKYVRSNLKSTELGLSMHPISQALQEYPEMQQLYIKLHELLGIEAPGRIQMLSRLGYGPELRPSPRWPLEKRMIA